MLRSYTSNSKLEIMELSEFIWLPSLRNAVPKIKVSLIKSGGLDLSVLDAHPI
ncbi:MAG: hypothetical protein AAF599_01185 [Bacteroidota bacterium]